VSHISIGCWLLANRQDMAPMVRFLSNYGAAVSSIDICFDGAKEILTHLANTTDDFLQSLITTPVLKLKKMVLYIHTKPSAIKHLPQKVQLLTLQKSSLSELKVVGFMAEPIFDTIRYNLTNLETLNFEVIGTISDSV
jgi:hypothetical protein